MSLQFYDFEVFKYDWLVVIKNPITKTVTKIANDIEQLREYYEQFKGDIWVGFNSRDYDQYILKAILFGMNPKKVSDFIIVNQNKGWQYSREFNKIPFNNYDVFLGLTDKGLKTHAAFKGHGIHETDVSFDIDRKLTAAELAAEFEYCGNDVNETIDDFIERKAEFDFMMFFINRFKLPLSCISKTKSQLLAYILEAKGIKFDDEFDYRIMPTVKIEKYTEVLNFFTTTARQLHKRETESIENYRKRFYSQKFSINISNVPHVFAWGGIHGAIKKYYGKGIYIMADAEAYYPSSQYKYKIGYRQMGNPENFEFIHDSNIDFKRKGDKVARQPFKIGDNSIGGQLKDKTSKLYDPRESNTMLINCQLWLLDLNEKLEATGRFQLIQSNTDGVVWKLENLTTDFELFDDIVYEWENRTGFKMEFALFDRIFQKDVNNYVIANGDKYKSKGAYTKELNRLDYDLAIVNKAMIDFMVYDIPVEQTINECQEYRAFMKVVKISSKYDYGTHNNQKLIDKTFRVFASKNPNDTFIGKVKENKSIKEKRASIYNVVNLLTGEKFDTLEPEYYTNEEYNEDANNYEVVKKRKDYIKIWSEKFANTPAHCFIDNGNIVDKIIPKNLDRRWYVELAKKRLRQYGVEV